MRDINRILTESRTIAVVGLSPRPDRDSHRVARYLQEQGYRIIPVNPMVPEVLGQPSYPSLTDVPEPVDIVDIFRRIEEVPPLVEQAIACNARVVWLQLGIVHEEAAENARRHGLDVVMNRCTLVEHRKLTTGAE